MHHTKVITRDTDNGIFTISSLRKLKWLLTGAKSVKRYKATEWHTQKAVPVDVEPIEILDLIDAAESVNIDLRCGLDGLPLLIFIESEQCEYRYEINF